MSRTNHPLTPNKICRCSACGEVFAGLTVFDRHRIDGRCLDPADVGLKIRSRPKGTVWVDPSFIEVGRRMVP